MIIRSADPEDFDAIKAIAREAWHDTYDELEADVIDRTVDDWYTDDSMPLDAPSTVVLVAERAGTRSASASSRTQSVEDGEDGEETEIVGFTHAVAQGERADVLRMYVHPDHQGEGIGTKVHERLVAELEAHGVDEIRALDFAFNDASRRFYEGLGFERADSGEVVIDGESYDEAVYALEL